MLSSGAALPSSRRWHAGATAAIAVLLAALVAYLLVTPIGEQSDELAHLHYASLIAHHASLPTDGIQERQQPPLYYAMVAVVLKLSGDNLRAARWVSVVLVVLTALLLYATLRRVAPARPGIALAGLVAFCVLPGVQYEGAQVSNDTLAWAAGALVLLIVVAVVRAPRLSPRLAALAGVAIGIALMAKATTWPLAALLAAALVVRHGRGIHVASAAAVVAPVLAIAGWWFARNLATFHRLLPPMTPLGSVGEHTLRHLHQLPSWVSLTWKSAVGFEGPKQTPLVVGPGRLGLYALTTAGVALLVVVGAALLAEIPAGRRHAQGAVPWLLAAPLLALAFSLVNSIALDNQPQSRYLLVAATTWCGGVAWALARVTHSRPEVRRTLAVLLVVGMLVLDAATLETLRLIA